MAKKITTNYGAPNFASLGDQNLRAAITQRLTPELQDYFRAEGLQKLAAEASSNLSSEIQSKNNLNLNSLRGLYIQANSTDFENPNLDYANSAAASMMNRINSAQSKDELNGVLKDLEDLRDKASSNTAWFPKVGEFFTEGVGGYKAMSSKEDLAKSLLKTTNPIFDKDTLNTLDSDQMIDNVKGLVRETNSKLFANAYINSKGSAKDFEALLNKAVSSPDKKNAFNDLLTAKLKDNFTTRGNDFYREGPEGNQFRTEALKAINNNTKTLNAPFTNPSVGDMLVGPSIALTHAPNIDNEYFKYDLENEGINDLRLNLFNKLTQQTLLPEQQQDKTAIESYRRSLDLLDKRQKENKKIYGVEEFEPDWQRIGGKGRQGSLSGAARYGIMDFTNTVDNFFSLGRSDFQQTISKKAAYQPTVIAYDKDGNAVTSTQFMYTKEDGSIGYNGRAIVEGGITMVTQMLPTLAIAAVTKNLGVAAMEIGAVANSMKNINQAVKASNTLAKLAAGASKANLANRVGTFATVALTTYPSMLAEEKKWGGDYEKRAQAKAAIEGLTEAIGFPEFGGLKVTPFTANLASDALRAGGLGVTGATKFKSALSNAYQFGKMGIKQNVLESLEEEMSLIGNALVDNAMFSDEYEKMGREKTRVSLKTVTDTLTDSFAAGLLYSGATTGFNAYLSTRPKPLQEQAQWYAANNPELYKKKLIELNRSGVIDDNKLALGLEKVNQLSNTLESMVELSNIRDMRTLLEDKDAQYNYFHSKLRRDNLMMVDYDSLTDEEKTRLANYKISDRINKKGKQRLDEITKQVAEILTAAESENRNLTSEEINKKKSLEEEGIRIKAFNRQGINKEEISDADKEYFKQKGLLTDRDLTYSPEDLKKEIESLDKVVLETNKRVERYANLTKEQRDEIVLKSYQDRIDSVGEVNDAFSLVDSRAKLGADIEYLKKKNRFSDAAEIEAKERLYNAYGERFDQLTNERDENGRNALEKQIEDTDYESMSESNNMKDILDSLEFLEANKDFISEPLFRTALTRLQTANTNFVAKYTNLTPEERVPVLADVLEGLITKDATYAYSIPRLEELLGKGMVTEEDLDAARQEVIQRRVKAKQDTSLKQTDSEEDKEFKEEFEIFKQTPPEESQVDETGSSPAVVKTNENYQRIKNSLQQKFNELSREKFEEFLINTARVVFSKGTRNYNSLIGALTGLFKGTISTEDFTATMTELGEKLKLDIAAKQKNNKDTKNLEQDLANLRQVYNFAIKHITTPSTVTPAAPSARTAERQQPKEEKTEQTKQENILEAGSKHANAEVDLKIKERINALMTYASPFRTNAVEYNDKDELDTDPAVVRNVDLINVLASIENAKIQVSNSKFFLLQFLLTKFPDKTYEQALSDFAKIGEVFENSILEKDAWLTLGDDQKDMILQPINDLLGKNFFSNATLNFYFNSRGEKLSKNPSPVITAVDQDNNLVLSQGQPLNLNLVTRSATEFNISKGILEELGKVGVSKSQAVDANRLALNQVNALEKKLKEDDELFLLTPFRVSEGVVLQSTYDKASASTDTNLQKASIEDFIVLTQASNEIFGKAIKGELGRLYYNNNGNPVKLKNTTFTENEAAAIAELLFGPQTFFRRTQELKDYLESIVNQVDSYGRLFFNKTEGSNFESPYPINVVYSVIENGKRVNRRIETKEDFIEVLTKQYYRADASATNLNSNIKRFSMVDGKVTMSTQPYLEYIKDTHLFPLVNGVVGKPANKVIYMDTARLSEAVPEVKETVAPTPVKTQTTEAPKTSAPIVNVVPKNSPMPTPATPKEFKGDVHGLLSFEGAVSAAKILGVPAVQKAINDMGKEGYELLVKGVAEGKIKITQMNYLDREAGKFTPYNVENRLNKVPVLAKTETGKTIILGPIGEGLTQYDHNLLIGFETKTTLDFSILDKQGNEIVREMPEEKEPEVSEEGEKKEEVIATTNNMEAKIADIERRRQEELKFTFGDNIELISSGKIPVIERIILFTPKYPKGANRPANTEDAQKLVNEYKEINDRYDKLIALEKPKATPAPVSLASRLNAADRTVTEEDVNETPKAPEVPSKISKGFDEQERNEGKEIAGKCTTKKPRPKGL